VRLCDLRSHALADAVQGEQAMKKQVYPKLTRKQRQAVCARQLCHDRIEIEVTLRHAAIAQAFNDYISLSNLLKRAHDQIERMQGEVKWVFPRGKKP
jgi:hypothetical protein